MPGQYKNVRVCSAHFLSGAPSTLYDVTNPDWAPTLNLGYDAVDDHTTRASTERYERAIKRRKVICDGDNVQVDDYERPLMTDDEHGNDDDESGTAVQTELTFGLGLGTTTPQELQTYQETIKELQSELEKVKKENTDLRKAMVIEHTMRESDLVNDDKKVLYYTGLNSWELLNTLFQYMKPRLCSHVQSSLSPFQQLLVTLMRLRLNLPGRDLAYRFSIHESTISRIFARVLEVLFNNLKPLIIWPERDALKKTMPVVFRKHYPKCVVIIDCFEIFIDRPTNLLA